MKDLNTKKTLLLLTGIAALALLAQTPMGVATHPRGDSYWCHGGYQCVGAHTWGHTGDYMYERPQDPVKWEHHFYHAHYTAQGKIWECEGWAWSEYQHEPTAQCS